MDLETIQIQDIAKLSKQNEEMLEMLAEALSSLSIASQKRVIEMANNLRNLKEKDSLANNAPSSPSQPASTSTEKAKSFTKEEKIAIAIKAIKTGNLTQVAKDIGKPESTVRGWRDQFKAEVEQKLAGEESKKGKRRRQREPKFIKMEKKLLEEIFRRREDGLTISMAEIKHLALEYAKELYPTSGFSASNGWFTRYVKRYHLSRRTPTHVMQTACENFQVIVNSFFKEIRTYKFKLEVLKEIPLKSKILFVNMDEVINLIFFI